MYFEIKNCFSFVVLFISSGATGSHAVIMNSDGKIIGQASGLGTNHHLLGMTECQRRIAELVEKSKKSAGIPNERKLNALVSKK